MSTIQYNSNQADKKSSLIVESWKVFSQFLNRYQWAFDEPGNSPRKSEIAHAILNQGKPGCCTFFRPEGYTCKLNLLRDWAFENAITKHRKIYYVSFGNQVLLYFDIDLHNDWQKLSDGQEAKEKLDGLFARYFGGLVLFWSPSSRGFNGYLKVNLLGMDYEIANKVFDRLEDALERFLAFCKNMADFEIKGKIGFLLEDGNYHWAPYGKLPIHHPGWNFAKLEQFKKTPEVSIHRVIGLCSMIEAQVPLEVLVHHKENKERRGNSPIEDKGFFLVTPAIEKVLVDKHGEGWRYKFSMLRGDGEETWLHKDYLRPGKAPLTERELKNERDKKEIIPHERHHLAVNSPVQRFGGTVRPCTNEQGRGSERTAAAGIQNLRDAERVSGTSGKDRHNNETTSELDERNFHTVNRPVQWAGDFVRPGTGERDRGGKRTSAGGAQNLRDAGRDHGTVGEHRNTKGETPESPKERPLPLRKRDEVQEVLFANVYVDDLLTEPDSFKRQLEALRRLARYLKRVPTQDEAMDFLKQRKLHSGSWEDNLANRDRRVRDILRYIAQTFDPAKCAKGSVNVGKYDSWAKKAFPNGLTGQLRGGMTEYMERYSGVTVHVSSSFISVFLSVVEFALLMDRNEDHSLPHNRAEQLWTALNVSVKFDARKWAVCRDQLEKHGVITIIDRNYSSGKAMKWAVGTYFPFLGLWKTKKERSILGPASLPTRRNRTTEQHNTLLQWQSVPSPVLGSLKLPRPPPVAINSS